MLRKKQLRSRWGCRSRKGEGLHRLIRRKINLQFSTQLIPGMARRIYNKGTIKESIR